MIWREYVHHVHEVTDGFHLLDVNTTTPPNRTAGWPMDLQSDDTQHPNHLKQTNRYLWHIGDKHPAWIVSIGRLKA